MRAVIQRVQSASVTVGNETVGRIPRGLLVLLGVGRNDNETDAAWIAEKTAELRVFEDADGKMNLSVQDVRGEVLVVSQFTLFGDCRHGRRPGFSDAAPPETANALYQHVVAQLTGRGIDVQTGQFRANMQVALVNDGPVTLLLDSKKLF